MFTENESEPTEETTTETEGTTATETERETTTETVGTTTTTPQGNTSECLIGSSIASCNKCSEWEEAVEVTKNLHGGVRVNREMVDRVKELGRDQTIRMKVDVVECRACGKQFVRDCQRTDEWEGQQQESVV